LELDSKVGEFWLVLADSEFHLNNFESAESAYKKVLEYDPTNDEIWLEYSHLLMVTNRKDEAIALLDKGIAKHPDNAELIYRSVCYHYNCGLIAEAYRILTEALEKKPKLYDTMFDYSPEIKNDHYVMELIESYKTV